MKKVNLVLLLLIATFSVGFASSMEIYAEVSSKIISMKPAGSIVKKGDILVNLDDVQLKSQINQMNALVKYQKLILDDAVKILDESTELYDSTVAPKRELDLAKIDEQKARYNYEVQVAKLQFYKQEQKKYTIKAPFDCKVKSIVSPRNTTNIYNSKPLMEIENN